MTVCFLAPDPVQGQFFIPTGGGTTPGNGVQVFFYVSGSSTKQTVYKDPAASVAWTNPIILDSTGNLPLGGEVWFPSGQLFTAKWAPSNDTDPPASPYRTMDNLSGMNDVSSSGVSDWIASTVSPTFVSGTSFTLPGDQTLLFTNGRRVKTTNTGGTVYSTITSVGFGAGITTVRVANDSLTLDSGISAVFYGLIDPAASSVDFYHVSRNAPTVTTSANGTTDIWGIAGTSLHITGTNAIFNFSTAAYSGAMRWVIADSAFPINTSASLSIPGNLNVTTSIGDRFIVNASSQTGAVIEVYQSGSSSQAFQAPATSGFIFASPTNTSGTPKLRPIQGADASVFLLSTKSAQATSQVLFTSTDVNWVDYDEYWVDIVQLIPTSSNVNVQARFSADGGTTFNSSNIYSSIQREVTVATTQTMTFQPSQPLINLNNLGISNASSDYGMNGRIEINRPSSIPRKEILWKFVFPAPSSSLNLNDGVAQIGSTGALNGLVIFCNQGFSSGAISVHGIRKT